MPRRDIPFINDEYYHVYNRGINKREIFSSEIDYTRMLITIDYYKYKSALSLSSFLALNNTNKNEMVTKKRIIETLRLEMISFCLMPNHFHFLVKQKTDHAVQSFMSDIQNSYTRYYNIKYRRRSPLLNNQFKAKKIENEEVLLHVSRYIHLNPYTSSIVYKKEELVSYPWSSLKEYSSGYKERNICNTDVLYSLIQEPYIDFVLNNAEYQRQLKKMG